MKKIKDFFNSDKGFTFLSVFVILIITAIMCFGLYYSEPNQNTVTHENQKSSFGYRMNLRGKKFTVWNPNTNDTLYHFFRGKGQFGDCWFDYKMIGHRVKWHCQNMAMVHKTDTTVIKDISGQISLNPFTYYCESVW